MRLQKSKFQRWLRAKRPDEIVGHNRDCHSCPIALFYQEASRGCEVVIFEQWGEYIIDRGYLKSRAPGWAENFIFAVDGNSEGKISASCALEILARC